MADNLRALLLIRTTALSLAVFGKKTRTGIEKHHPVIGNCNAGIVT